MELNDTSQKSRDDSKPPQREKQLHPDKSVTYIEDSLQNEDDFGVMNSVPDSEDEENSATHVLEVLFQHINGSHSGHKPGDVVSYRIKNPDGKYADLDLEDSSSDPIHDEELRFEFDDKVVIVKQSAVDKYRLKNNYFGPIKVLVETLETFQEGQRKRIDQIKFQHVILKAQDKSGKEFSGDPLIKLIEKAPAIIPQCDPPKSLDDQGHFLLAFGEGDSFAILRKAISAFRQLSGHSGFLNTRIKKLFKPVKGKLTAITILKLYPKLLPPPLNLGQEAPNDQQEPTAKGKKSSDAHPMQSNPHLMNCYSQNYINWRHRGSVILSQLKNAGVDFIKEVMSGTSEIPGPIKELGCSYISLIEDEINEAPRDVNSFEGDKKEPSASLDSPEALWNIALGIAGSKATFIILEFECNNEKWLEIKRTINTFQVNEEVHSDIVLKLTMHKEVDKDLDLVFYIRCVGRLVKSGKIRTKSELEQIFSCLAGDRYICIGQEKDDLISQLDQNEMLKHFVKENGFLVMSPFEALHSKDCKGIVRAPPTDNPPESVTFSRGSVMVVGTYFQCKPCAVLKEKISRLLDPNLDESKATADSECTRFVRHRYGPVKFAKMNKNLRNLFTQTPTEFVSKSRAQNSKARVLSSSSLPRKRKSPDFDGDFPDELISPEIKVTEEEFAKMVRLEPSSVPSPLRKSCNVCGFETKSMLSLFSHMGGHLGPLTHSCCRCNLQFSSEEALKNHSKVCIDSIPTVCSKCFKSFQTQEKLDDHMNIHRGHMPFACHLCDEKLTTLNRFKKHIKLQHNILIVKELNFICKTCAAYFYTQDYLFIHRVNSNHDTLDGLVCKHCNYASKTVSHFFQHLSSHSMEVCEKLNTVPCMRCQKLFFSLHKYQNHLMAVHNELLKTNESQPVSQEEVDPHTQNSQELLYTESRIEITPDQKVAKDVVEEVPYPPLSTDQWQSFTCEHCKRQFDSEHKYKRHVKLHTNTRPVFQCEECGFVYAKREQVVEHIRRDHYNLLENASRVEQPGESKDPQSTQQEVKELEFLNDVEKEQAGWNGNADPQGAVYEILHMPEFP